MSREDLETLATETISPDLYYDLCDTIDSVTDEELYKLIACDGKGNLKLKKLFKTKELAIQQRKSWEKNYGS